MPNENKTSFSDRLMESELWIHATTNGLKRSELGKALRDLAHEIERGGDRSGMERIGEVTRGMLQFTYTESLSPDDPSYADGE